MSDIEQLREQMFNGVLDDGYVVQFVEADPTSVLHKGVPYAYTAGRTMAGKPEFLVTGLDRAMAQDVLDHMVSYDDLDLGATRKFKLTDADPAPLLGAIAMFGAGHVRATQILWPDLNGRYPDEPGFVGAQPLHPLGVDPLNTYDPYKEDS